jgi:hypothetical protein
MGSHVGCHEQILLRWKTDGSVFSNHGIVCLFAKEAIPGSGERRGRTRPADVPPHGAGSGRPVRAKKRTKKPGRAFLGHGRSGRMIRKDEKRAGETDASGS